MVAKITQPKCNYCNKHLGSRKVKITSCKCGGSKYCSQECLKYDQPNHKQNCLHTEPKKLVCQNSESGTELNYCSYSSAASSCSAQSFTSSSCSVPGSTNSSCSSTFYISSTDLRSGSVTSTNSSASS